MTYPRADQSPAAHAFGALLNDALNGHPRVHLPPYHRPAPIRTTQPLTLEQAEHDRQARAHIGDYDEWS
jgi:hypothetical protein